METLRHVSMIMDGNRRWAKKHILEPWKGHEAGRKTLSNLIRYWATKTDIECLSLFSLSLDNFSKRTEIERQFLYKQFIEGFTELLKDPVLKAQQIRVRILGRWALIPNIYLKSLIQKVMSETKGYDKRSLSFFICYDGQDELVEAAKKVARGNITKGDFKRSLFTAELPEVDLMIRTGGEQRISGFMLWDISYAELYFTDVLFPDFDAEEFDKAVEEYNNRKRRFGK
jgi:undecaprenyl diphosphate synthase